MTTVAPAYLGQFGLVTIPGARGRFQWPAQARQSVMPTIGGAFDAAGSGAAGIQLPYQLAYTGAAVHATDTTEVQDQLDDLRGLCGTRDRLWLRMADTTERWAWARLSNVSPAMVATDRAVVAFQMVFQMLGTWNGSAYGGAWDLDSGYLFDSGLYLDTTGPTTLNVSPKTITVANAGNLAVTNAGITVTAGAANITALTIGIASVCEFTFTGTIASGKSLVIDCGSKTVLNDGVAAWSSFALTSNHAVEPWLLLAAATSNSVVVTKTGGSTDSTIIFTYSDGWV